MSRRSSLADEIVTYAESFPDIRAGMARLEDVLNAPSYRAVSEGAWSTSLSSSHDDTVTRWPPKARTVLVLGLRHPEDDLGLDWWVGGNTPGNQRLTEVSESMKHWLQHEHHIGAHPLPYHVERGGLFLKDAAVLAGLGIIGRNNLLVHPDWGPRIRFRCMLIEEDLEPTGLSEAFSPCETCQELCRQACPQDAFSLGMYHRPSCIIRMDANVAHASPTGEIDEQGNPIRAIHYCRACERACSVGA